MHDAGRRSTPRLGLAVVASVVTAVSLGGCAGSTPHAASYGGHRATHPTAAEQAATLAATEGYRRYLVTSAEALGASLDSVENHARAGNLAATRTAELAAQRDFDAIRGDLSADSTTTLRLDGERWDLGGGAGSGLHAIEFDLFGHVDLAAAARVAASLRPEVFSVTYLLSRAVLSPAQILAQSQAQLVWAVEVPAEGREELYSHLDLVDVSAAVAAASTGVELCVPLVRIVAPATTALVGARLALLRTTITALGVPWPPDGKISEVSWQRIASALDAADGPIGILEGDVQQFASGRLYA